MLLLNYKVGRCPSILLYYYGFEKNKQKLASLANKVNKLQGKG